jgi:hypothetical protein
MRERLIELLSSGGKCDKYGSEGCEACEYNYFDEKCETHLTELMADDLLANGVIVPPCKVGDTVYCIEHKTIHECVVKTLKSLNDVYGTKFFVEVECEIVSPFYSDGRKIKHCLMAVWKIEWGSWHRAFPSREEAEKALRERSGG